MSIEEILMMFHKHEINITRHDLKEFFRIVELDNQCKIYFNDLLAVLNLAKFEKCALDENTNNFFISMMKELKSKNNDAL